MKQFHHNFSTKHGVVCRILSIKGDSTYESLISLCRHELSFKTKDNHPVLKLGDIVLLEPSGQGTVLYEIESNSNAVLLTERCNSRCIMCPQPPRNSGSDDYRISIETIALLGEEIEVLGITGGEPTLAWTSFIDVLKACREHIPQARIELLTNARVLKNYALAKEVADISGKTITACVPIYSDVDHLHDRIVAAKGAFWETIEGIYNLERAKVPVEIRTVITKQNYNRLPQWAEFIYKTFPFACHVAIMGLEPTGLAKTNLDILWVDASDYMENLEETLKILHRRNMNVSIYNNQLCLLPRNLWRFSRKTISEWKNIYLHECDKCSVRADCGGFFHSSADINIKGLKAI
jgi:His-Xaa-Ser system radical SAM maturase HxsC